MYLERAWRQIVTASIYSPGCVDGRLRDSRYTNVLHFVWFGGEEKAHTCKKGRSKQLRPRPVMRNIFLLFMFALLAPAVAPTQTATRVRIPDYLAASITTRVVLPHDIGIPGDVVVEVLVERNGSVRSVRGVSGDKRLLRAAETSVMKWAFYPYFVNGEPVQFLAEMTIQFDGKKQSAKLKVSKDPLASGGVTPKLR